MMFRRWESTVLVEMCSCLAIVGELFSPLFGEEAKLTPHHPAEPKGVERWLLAVKNIGQEAEALLAENQLIRELRPRFNVDGAFEFLLLECREARRNPAIEP